jgi:Leucine-rich repeat (LRR) protein
VKLMRRIAICAALMALSACGPRLAPDKEEPKKPEPREDAEAIKALEKMGARLTRDEKAPGRPVIRATNLLGGPPGQESPLKHVARLGFLRELSMPSTPGLTARDLASLEALTSLEALDLSYCAIDDAGLAAIAKLPALKRLRLRGSAVTAAGLQALASLTRLTELDLGYCPGLDDQSASHLAGLTSLERLELPGCKGPQGMEGAIGLTDAGVSHLAGLTALTQLDLSGIPLGDEGVKKLATLKRLVALNLEDTRVTDAGLTALSGLPIETLNLNRTRAEGGALAKLPRLKHVSVRELPASDHLARALAQASALESADFHGCPLSDSQVAQLKGSRSLKMLDLSKTRVTSAVFETLQDIPSLRQVLVTSIANGDDSKEVSEEAVERFRKSNPRVVVKD